MVIGAPPQQGGAVRLRPYQDRTLDVLRGMFRAGKRRVILYSPTGSGKTEMAMEMVKGSRAKQLRVLFTANRIELVGQAWRRFWASGIEAGVIQGDNTRGADRPVVIASIQTLARRGLPPFDLLIVDEAHGVAGSKEYTKLLQQAAGKFVIGLTATPFAKGMAKQVEGLGALFEGIAKATTIRELIDLGFLVDVDIFGPSEPDLEGVKIVAGDYHEGQLEKAVDQPKLIGDIVSHWHRLAGNKQTVVFATSIAHSQHIVEQFQSTGVIAEHIDCYTEDEDRRKILDRFSRGETKVVSNVAVLAEGWDCPTCEVMVLARPTRSLIRYIQMAGRVLRPAPGKERALILDHSGTVKRLGFPTDDLPLELDDGTRKQSEDKAREERERLPQPCPSCTYLMPAKSRKCPACGFQPERPVNVEQEDGELVQMKRKRGKIATQDKEQVYAELLGYARDKGYRDGWAYYAAKELFGSAPKKRLEPAAASALTLRLVKHLNIKRAKARERHAA